MVVYTLTITLLIVLGVLSINYSYEIGKNSLGEDYNKIAIIFKILTFLCILLVYACRWRTGTDTIGYIKSYYSMGRYSITDVLELHDTAFYMLCWIDYKLFQGSLILHNCVLGIITYAPVWYIYEKYSKNFPVAIIFFIVTTGYYFSFNGQRQAVAIGICMIGYIFILMQKRIRGYGIVVFSTLFHSTAFIMLPMLLLANRKTKSKIFVISAGVMFFSAFSVPRLWQSIFSILESLGQDRLVTEYADQITAYAGANILRFLVLLAPIILALLFYKDLSEHNQDFDIVLNLNILGAIWMMAGNSNWLFARLSSYTMPLLPILLIRDSEIFNESSQKLYYIAVTILFGIYMYVYVQHDSSLIPYYFIDRNHVFW